MEFDDVLSYVGHFGRYQCLLYCGIACAIITTALRDLSVVFTLDIPDYRCAIPGLENDTYNNQNGSHLHLINVTIPADDKCHIYTNTTRLNGTAEVDKCSAWVYDKSIYQSTVATDFDLVCDKTILSTVINMIYAFGGLFGALFGGKLTDKFGRKIVWVTSCIGLGVAGLGFSLSTNIYMLMAFRVFEGFFGVPAYMSTFTYGMEIIGPRKRALGGSLIGGLYPVGTMLVAPIAYYMRNWVYLSIALSVPAIVLILPLYCLLPESPRWQLAKGRRDQAKQFLRTAARMNQKPPIPEKVLEEMTVEEEVEEGSMIHVLKNRVMLKRIGIAAFNWFAASTAYYGLSLNSGNLVGDLYVNYVVTAAVELPACIFTYLTLDRLGRKGPHVFSMFLCGTACLTNILIVLYVDEEHHWITVALSTIGKFGSTAAFTIIYIYASELFPTTTRNGIMGLCSMGGRVGSMVSPYIASLGDMIVGIYGVVLPMTIFGVVALAAGILAIFLPETMGEALPDTIEQALELGKRKKKQSGAHDNPTCIDNDSSIGSGLDYKTFGDKKPILVSEQMTLPSHRVKPERLDENDIENTQI